MQQVKESNVVRCFITSITLGLLVKVLLPTGEVLLPTALVNKYTTREALTFEVPTLFA